MNLQRKFVIFSSSLIFMTAASSIIGSAGLIWWQAQNENKQTLASSAHIVSKRLQKVVRDGKKSISRFRNTTENIQNLFWAGRLVEALSKAS